MMSLSYCQSRSSEVFTSCADREAGSRNCGSRRPETPIRLFFEKRASLRRLRESLNGATGAEPGRLEREGLGSCYRQFLIWVLVPKRGAQRVSEQGRSEQSKQEPTIIGMVIVGINGPRQRGIGRSPGDADVVVIYSEDQPNAITVSTIRFGVINRANLQSIETA